MKNLIKNILLLGAINFTVGLNAGVTVNWSMNNDSAFVFRSNGTTPLPFGSVWQLIWSSTNSAPSAPMASNPFTPATGDVILSQTQVPNAFSDDGYIFAVNVNNPSVSLVGGYVYTRVFDYQGNVNDFNPFTDSVWYGTSSVISGPLGNTTTGDPSPALPSAHDPFPTSFTLNQQFVAIPEPGTLATIAGGLAVVVFGLRRRRYRI